MELGLKPASDRRYSSCSYPRHITHKNSRNAAGKRRPRALPLRRDSGAVLGISCPPLSGAVLATAGRGRPSYKVVRFHYEKGLLPRLGSQTTQRQPPHTRDGLATRGTRFKKKKRVCSRGLHPHLPPAQLHWEDNSRSSLS